MCQCPLGLLPHFYREERSRMAYEFNSVSMPSRAVTSFLPNSALKGIQNQKCVSMPSRAVTSFLPILCLAFERRVFVWSVNALSGCYLISTRSKNVIRMRSLVCQCPLGLLPHFYKEESFVKLECNDTRVNALSGCYLISTLARGKFMLT